jgi:hypothetical protein
MYTDYQAETYFLQNSREMHPCIEKAGVNAPIITQGPAGTSHMVLVMHAHSGFTANNLTPNPETSI